MKKIIYLIISMLIILLLIFYFKGLRLYKDYVYSNISNNEIMLVKYIGNEKNISIPTYIKG